jgi:N-acetylneuraminic acid mutarotase
MKPKSIFKVAMLAGLLSVTSVSLATDGVWTQKTDMPTARFGLSASVVNDRIYAIGGATGPQQDLRIVEEYDPATDSWTKKTDMPNTRCWHSTSVINGKIYVIGGYAAGVISGMVEEYDPATETWTRKADMPTPRWLLSTSVVNGKIYAIGGANDSGDPFSTVEEYNPLTDTWTRKANMPTRRFALSTSVVNGKIYVIGGASGWQVFVRVVEEYDPATDTWQQKANIPTSRWWLSTSVTNGKIYAIGGCVDVHGATFSAVEAYDPENDSWIERADMLNPRKALATCVVNGKIYAIGRSAVPHWNTGFSMVEEYNLIPLPPDFNGDGIVDIKDLLRLIESWGLDDPLYDIAPPPFGDGIVDAIDLELLMSYWKQPIDDPTLMAHWALDEAEGTIAYDSAGVNDAVVVGGATWQPNGGQVNGALQLDGIDGCVVAGPVLNPADGPFSVLAWIQGGAPGQVILSQQGAANWLTADSEGNLMTELAGPGRNSDPLWSQTLITDNTWHRIGFVWDGLNRALYVDDILVAEAAQSSLEGSQMGLYIGTGKNMEPGTYFSGLIEDIRIYNRAMSP